MGSEDREAVGRKVRFFYEGCFFPAKREFETLFDPVKKAQRGFYGKLLYEQLPLGARTLDGGYGK
ncbi:MAG: hypothetical protein ACREQA_21750 [Candidatus Binatia bacterium]